MSAAHGSRADWTAYMDGLAWKKGQLDVASWNSFLRAASCGVDRDDAMSEVAKRLTAAGSGIRVGKLQSQCRRAYDHVGSHPSTGSTWSPRGEFRRSVPKPVFDDGKLKAFAQEWSPTFSDEGKIARWFGDRSSVDPATVDAGSFLEALYQPGEYVLLFSNFQSQGQLYWRRFDNAGRWGISAVRGCEGVDLAKPARDFAKTLSGPEGVWFLAQPVDGMEHANPREKRTDGRVKMSRRSQESVTSWRYLVLESDAAAAADWLGALVQLPLRIVAIYTSGGKSIHGLVRVDAPSKAHWDAARDAMLPILVTLGGDPAAMTAVRLTRLPGCHRSGRLQKLLYLNPKASGLLPICALPPKRDVVGDWKRWAQALAAAPDEEFGPVRDDLRELVPKALAHYGLKAEVAA